jgi:hypothetical protein
MSSPSFLITAAVVLKERAKVFDSNSKEEMHASGYYRTFAVSACSEDEATKLVEDAISDGLIDLEDFEIRALSAEEANSFPESPSGRNGIWYSSGRVYFP